MVEVRENVPVTQIEDVRVELVTAKTTAGYEHDRGRGFLSWKLPLGAGKESTVDLAYTIHLPEDWAVR